MSAPKDINPVRLFVARVVYWSLWGPMVAIASPFALVVFFVEWLNWTAFPWMGKYVQPVWASMHDFALKAGVSVLGKEPDE